jgi:hypothetical protein
MDGQFAPGQNIQMENRGTQAPPMATISYVTSAVSTANATVYTFAGTSIGTAATDRRLVIAVSNQAASIIATTFVKVDTVAAVKLVSGTQLNIPSGAGASAELWIIDKPTGTTASIEVTHASGTLRCGIAVWAVYGLSSNTPTDTAVNSGTTTGRTASIDCNAGGVIIGLVSGSGAGAGRTHTWAGITENVDQIIEGQGAHSAASLGFAATQTGLSVTTTASASVSTDILVVAALR